MSKQPKQSLPGKNATGAAAAMSPCDDPRLEAAQKRIRESVGQADTFEAVREIVTNLLGCEEVGLFSVNGDKAKSALLWSFGIDTERHGTLDAFDKAVLHRVMQGEMHVAQLDHAGYENHDHPPLRVFAPIRCNGQTVGVLVMLTLLPQKVSFDESDINLVKLLSAEAGKALFDRSANANA
jgi:GAF domain-containing protein